VNIPEVTTPPTEALLEHALRVAVRDYLSVLHRDDRPTGLADVDPAEEQLLVGAYLKRAAVEVPLAAERWLITDAGRQYLRDYPASPEDLL
jgi:hypothetical protein